VPGVGFPLFIGGLAASRAETERPAYFKLGLGVKSLTWWWPVERDVELIKRRMLLEMQKKLLRASQPERKEVVDYERIFVEHLTDDGRMMYEKAVEQYGEEARRIAEKLGRLYRSGRLQGLMNAETVYWVFREVGLPIKIETRIVYKKGGEVKSIGEMLRGED
jgi:DNA-binding TFAR19-related protein (PDSD5 family)